MDRFLSVRRRFLMVPLLSVRLNCRLGVNSNHPCEPQAGCSFEHDWHRIRHVTPDTTRRMRERSRGVIAHNLLSSADQIGIRFPQNPCSSCPYVGLSLGKQEMADPPLCGVQEQTTLVGLTSLVSR